MQNVEEWMCGKEKVDREEQYLSIFNRFLQNYHKWLNAEKLAKSNILDGKLYQTWFTTIADLLYTNYDYEKDEEAFLKQFELNVEAMETVFVKRKCEQKGPKKVSTFSTRFHVVSNAFPKYQMLTF